MIHHSRVDPRAVVGALVAGFAAALIPRLFAAGGDLWLDEIWSLYLLRNAKGPLDVLTIRHDNNHILNSLYLLALGPQEPALPLRLLAVVSGAAAVALMGLINLRHGWGAACLTMALGAISYPLIHYSSEARGYAPAMLSALASYLFLREALESGSRRAAALFQIAAALGFLAHFTFLYVYSSLVVWAVFRLARSGHGWRGVAWRLAAWNIAPVLTIAGLYLFFIRQMTLGGGDPQGLGRLLTSLGVLCSGFPIAFGPAAIPGVLIAAGAFLFGLLEINRSGRDDWVFFLLAAIVAPLLLAAIAQPGFLYERYFMAGMPFYFVAVGCGMAALLRGKTLAKVVVATLLAVFVIGNGVRAAELITTGRGGYRLAVEHLAAQTRGRDITLGSDHDFRNKMVLLYYSQGLPATKRLLYFHRGNWPAGGPEWFIAHSQEADYVPPPRATSAPYGDYVLERHFPFKGLSGWHWALYRRIEHGGGSRGLPGD